jgi:hypothetical protein
MYITEEDVRIALHIKLDELAAVLDAVIVAPQIADDKIRKLVELANNMFKTQAILHNLMTESLKDSWSTALCRSSSHESELIGTEQRLMSHLVFNFDNNIDTTQIVAALHNCSFPVIEDDTTTITNLLANPPKLSPATAERIKDSLTKNLVSLCITLYNRQKSGLNKHFKPETLTVLKSDILDGKLADLAPAPAPASANLALLFSPQVRPGTLSDFNLYETLLPANQENAGETKRSGWFCCFNCE